MNLAFCSVKLLCSLTSMAMNPVTSARVRGLSATGLLCIFSLASITAWQLQGNHNCYSYGCYTQGTCCKEKQYNKMQTWYTPLSLVTFTKGDWSQGRSNLVAGTCPLNSMGQVTGTKLWSLRLNVWSR